MGPTLSLTVTKMHDTRLALVTAEHSAFPATRQEAAYSSRAMCRKNPGREISAQRKAFTGSCTHCMGRGSKRLWGQEPVVQQGGVVALVVSKAAPRHCLLLGKQRVGPSMTTGCCVRGINSAAPAQIKSHLCQWQHSRQEEALDEHLKMVVKPPLALLAGSVSPFVNCLAYAAQTRPNAIALRRLP